MVNSIILCNHEVPIEIERKRIKKIYFRINDEGSLYITCSPFVTKYELNNLIEKDKHSIEKMYERYLNEQKKTESVYYLGEKLDFIESEYIYIEGNKAYGPSISIINKYLEDNCLEIFNKRLNIYINEFDNLPKFRLRVRKMKSRWGVCNIKSMTVTLNTLLIHKKVHLIDYVVCHELSHFHHMNHSSAFWKEVEKHYPDHKQARKELNEK